MRAIVAAPTSKLGAKLDNTQLLAMRTATIAQLAWNVLMQRPIPYSAHLTWFLMAKEQNASNALQDFLARKTEPW